jgi:hypothetical protein
MKNEVNRQSNACPNFFRGLVAQARAGGTDYSERMSTASTRYASTWAIPAGVTRPLHRGSTALTARCRYAVRAAPSEGFSFTARTAKVLLTLRSPFDRMSGEAGLMWLDASVLLRKQEATMASEAETRIRDLLGKLREEMRWLDVLRMLSAGGYPLLEREGFEEKIKAKASSDADDDAQGEDARIDGATLVRDSLAKFTLPDWLRADLELTEAWFLERAASGEAFEDEPPQRSVDVADDFGREALAALERIVELMKELEPMCTAAVEPIGAFNFWQLHTWAGIMLRGELAMSDQIGYAIGTPEEIANLDRLARRKAAEWMDQHERLAEEILAVGPLTDDELCAEVNRRWADPAVRERLLGAARPWAPGSVVLIPPPDDG